MTRKALHGKEGTGESDYSKISNLYSFIEGCMHYL